MRRPALWPNVARCLKSKKPANSDFGTTLVAGRTTESGSRALVCLLYLEAGKLDDVVMFDCDDLARVA
jgi:hypothetical protein